MKPLLLRSFSVISFLFWSVVCKTQIIYTHTGTGTAGFSGDGGFCKNANINGPTCMAIDATGNIYLSDGSNDRIRKITPSGIITTIAGTGTAGFSGDGGLATAAQISLPMGIAIDGSGNIYFSDMANTRVRKINTSGIISTVAGNGTAGYSGDGGPATSAMLKYPKGLALDISGNLYIADDNNHCIRKVTPTGTITTIAGMGLMGFSGDGGPATSAQMASPFSVAVDASGNIYIGDRINARIRKVNTSGIITTIVGSGLYGYTGDGGLATAAQIRPPYGITFDALGNLYFADSNNHCIRMVNTSGIITTVAGTGIAGFSGDGGTPLSAQFNGPVDIKFDGSNNLFVVDAGNNLIRESCPSNCFAGINSMNKAGAEITIYPNPSAGSFKLKIENEIENAELHIVNMLGQIVYRQEVKQGANLINSDLLNTGVYQCVILENKKQVYNLKLMIE